MMEEVTDLRKGERFVAAAPIEGTFNNSVSVMLLNVSLGGAQLMHAHPIRIGTQASLAFNRAGVSASVTVIVMWSHLSQTEEGLRYKTGVRLHEPDVRYATALNAFVRSGVIALDTDSLERKRQRQQEREMRRTSSPKVSALPPS